MSSLFTILKVIFSQFLQWGGGVEIKIFQNIKSLYLELQLVLKFGKERMKITLIPFVYVIFSSKWSLRKIFSTKKGESYFKKSKKIPLENSQIQLLSEFGVNMMKAST